MSDATDYLEELQRQREAEARARAEAEAAVRSLFPKASDADVGRAAYGLTKAQTEGGRTPAELRMLLVGQHQKETAEEWLQDPTKREALRALLRGDATALQGLANPVDPNSDLPGRLTGPDFSRVLEQLNMVPVPFVRPDLTVRREDVDTPEEMSRFLQKYHADDPVTRQILEHALQYGGLSLEPTPYGTMSRPGHGLEWYRPNSEPGEIEIQILAAHRNGRPLTPAEASAIAQERQGAFRLKDPNAIQDLIAKSILAGTFAFAGGAITNAAVAPLLGPLVGGGAGTSVGAIGAAPTAAAASSFIGGSPILFGTGLGIGAGAGAGATGTAASGQTDPIEILKAAGIGGLTGGIGAAIPSTGVAGFDALRGAGISGVGNATAQGLSGDAFDWKKFVQSLITGGAGGAASTLTFPGANLLIGLGGATGSALTGAATTDPLGGVNQQLDQRALTAQQDRLQQMQEAQERWKAQYAAASAEQQRLMQERMREYQQQYEQKRAEWQAKVDAYLQARQDQIAQALQAMGFAEGGIGSLLEEVRQSQAAARQQAAEDEARLIESRQFFPSALLDQTGPGGGDFAESGVLVPHSPPPVLFGQEGLPASYTDYAQAPPPTFSAEGLLPSGSLRTPPAEVAPMTPSRAPRYYASLLGGLTRSPYLRTA